jgi:hypothetical protein
MPASEARILANRKNAARSTGPKTEEGKAKSRANALKHGLTGSGVVMPEGDAVEVERRAVAFASELNASGEVGKALARRAALNSVRMERAADQQAVALTQKLREVEADFVAPEGVDEAEAAKLRSEAVRFAMFDPSKEATLARRYESAAERAFFRCLKELRQRERDARVAVKAETDQQVEAMMGSILQAARDARDEDDAFAAIYEELNVPLPSWSTKLPKTPGIDLPVTASRPR